MKLLQKQAVETPTFTVGQEIILVLYPFDGRTSVRKLYALTVTKVNRVTLTAVNKKGEEFLVDTRTDKITTREEIIKNALAEIN